MRNLLTGSPDSSVGKCNPSLLTMLEVTEKATQTVDTAKAKAIEMLDGVTEKKDTEEESREEKEGEVKKK